MKQHIQINPDFKFVEYLRYFATDKWHFDKRQKNFHLALNQYQYPIDLSDFPDISVENGLVVAYVELQSDILPTAALSYGIYYRHRSAAEYYKVKPPFFQITGFGGNSMGGGKAVIKTLIDNAASHKWPIIVIATPGSKTFYQESGFQCLFDQDVPYRNDLVLVKW